MRNEAVKVARWKEKAKQYRRERDAYRKRIQALTIGRDHWKSKYKRSQKERLVIGQKPTVPGLTPQSKPARHSYPVALISLALLLRRAHCSLRGCLEVLRVMSVYLGLELSIPSISSIRHWEKKLGHWRLHQSACSQERWAIILDESVGVGQQKLLVVLGVPLLGYQFGQALSLEQVRVLSVRLSASWKAEAIRQELVQLQGRGYAISYAISDGGTNLLKALRVSEITQIQDCTHALGKLLEKQYKKDEEFQAFTKACALFKRQTLLGEGSLVMPPVQRAKGRFLNLEPLCQWGCKLLCLLEEKPELLSESIREKIAWLLPYQDMLIQMHEQCQTMHALLKVLKNKGLSEQAAQQCRVILEESEANDFFKQGAEAYLQENLSRLSEDTCRLCCSDSIESLFGKYKNQLRQAPGQVVTDSCLTMANLTAKPQQEEIKQAMEKTKMVDLQQWKKENVPKSLLQKRRELFKSVG
ncbi:MAG: hypothetical protein WA958_04165 [Tunicatimonas sp.]